MPLNLHGVASRAVSSVNPMVPLELRVSTGYVTAADGSREPGYATPGAFVGSISGQTLTVTGQTSGAIALGQELVGNGVLPGSRVTALGTGTGGVGTYEVSRSQSVASGNFTTRHVVLGQVQALQYRDIQMLEGLNIQGVERAIYVSGRVDGVIRPDNKGGDLIIMPDGTVWLVSLVLEYWPTWCKFAVTRQNT